ncbi:uncharacterized protein LOC134719736 [Mytilus trossulus]|uniref:uncharacterized protein LOC134719736 n=1 Tax=Mytilus trossulus TaxID=6551 RepID=UPI003007050B
MADINLLEDVESYRREDTGRSESILKDATEDENKDTYSNQQAVTNREYFNEVLFKHKTLFEPSNGHDTKMVNQSDDNVFYYGINDEFETLISNENPNQEQCSSEICDATFIESHDDDQENVTYKKSQMGTRKTRDLTPFMQRNPSHMTVADWTHDNPPKKDSISDEVDTSARQNSKTKLIYDSSIADITENDLGIGQYPLNIHFEPSSESKVTVVEINHLTETNNTERDSNGFAVFDKDTESNDFHTSFQSITPVDNGAGSSCMGCITPVKVTTRTKIHKGDHIILSRTLYYHHAIVVEVFKPDKENSDKICLKLIHQTNSATGAVRDKLRRRGTLAKLKCKTETVDLKKVMICKYWGSIQPGKPEKVVERASGALNGDQHEFRYDVIDNNCEHFASWCVTGRKLSIQIRKVRIVLHIFVRKGLRGLGDEQLRNKVQKDHGLLCETCFERNKKMLGVTRRKVQHADHIQKGDIILYKYYKLQHCAVIMDVVSIKQKYIVCKIAHYAFRGPFTEKKIQSDILKVYFKGSVSVFDYSNSEFKTYNPDEVVSRAEQRIGEEMFSYFSNDSSHFARWCKLKLLTKEK